MAGRDLRIRLILLGLLLTWTLAAQSSNGYLTAGPGSTGGKLITNYAFGAEWVGHKSLGIGGEFGVVAGHNSFGLLTGNFYYHFPPANAARKLDPFVTAGAGAIVEILADPAAIVTLGGGVNYWFHSRLGLRFEVRDIVAPSVRYYNRHLWGVRAGIAIH